MSARFRQIAISACAMPAFTFIGLNRCATGHGWWAAMWFVLAAIHAAMLVEAIWSKRAAPHHSAESAGGGNG